MTRRARLISPPRAFTLVELLVVVAVIAILMGVLLPALGRARSTARLAECASGIRQLQLASDLYSQDHAGRYMPGAAGIQTTNLERWHGKRKTRSLPFEPKGGAITPYLDGAEATLGVRSCPDFAPEFSARAQSGLAFERGCGGYGYNNAFVGSERFLASAGPPRTWDIRTDALGAPVVRFAAPASTVAFADAALAAAQLIEYSFLEPARWPQYPDYRPDPSTHFRHVGGRASVAWLDGHVTSETRSASERSGVYPLDPGPLGIGWFGDTSDNRLYDYQ